MNLGVMIMIVIQFQVLIFKQKKTIKESHCVLVYITRI